MTIECVPLTESLVGQLRALADTPFTLDAFRDRWRDFGWTEPPLSDDDSFGFYVRVSDKSLIGDDGVDREPEPELAMWIDSAGQRIVSAVLSFAWWEDHLPDDHQTTAAFARARGEFDSAFDAAATVACAVLSEPDAEWVDVDEDHHRALVWGGSHGLLLLAQANHDIQWGLELLFWLLPEKLENFHPTTPLIDWLHGKSRLAHETYGRPPVT